MVSGRSIRTASLALSTAQVLLIAAVLALAWRMVTRPTPSSLNGEGPAAVTLASRDPAAPAADVAPLSAYAAIWQRDLRQPPFPPAPRKPQAKPEPPTPLPTLLGTFREASRGWAHILAANGTGRVLGVGERIDAYTVIAIEPGRARLQRDGQTYWIETPKPKPLIAQRP